MPLRLSMSRFVSYLLFRQYYGKKCSKFLRRLLRDERNSKAKKNGSEKELAKRAIMHIEQRLDSSMLRLCRFKPLFVPTSRRKIPPRSLIRGAHYIKSP